MTRRAESPPDDRLPPAASGRARAAGRFAAVAAAAVLLSGCSALADIGLDPTAWFGGDGRPAMAQTGEPSAVGDDEGEGAGRPTLDEMAQAPPSFAVGDRFTFDNPRVTWKVAETGEDRVRWVADTGDQQVTDANPLLPALAWRSDGQGDGRRLISDMNQPFFPLAPGKRVTFQSTVSSDQPPFAWEFTWRCDVQGTARVETPAGTFDTYRITCGRKRPDELTFFYAPAVGHYVRMINAPKPGGEESVRDLVAFESRQYMAFVDPKTSAMTGEAAGDGESDELPPASLQARAGDGAGGAESGGGDGGAIAEPEMPELDNPMDEPDPRFEVDGPVLVMGEGSKPRSALTSEGAAKSRESAMSTEPTPRPRETAETAETADTGEADEPAAAAGDPSSGTEGGTATQTARAPADPDLPEGMTRAKDLPDETVALHVASYKDPENVEAGWRQLTGENGDLLGSVRPIVRKVDLPEKGVFYRLLVGPVASMPDAEALCEALDSRDVYCDPMTL